MKQYILITVDYKGAFCIKNVIENENKEKVFSSILYSLDSIYLDEALDYNYSNAIKYIKDKDIVYKYEGPQSLELNFKATVVNMIQESIYRCKQAEKLWEFLRENNIKEDVNYIEKLLRTY